VEEASVEEWWAVEWRYVFGILTPTAHAVRPDGTKRCLKKPDHLSGGRTPKPQPGMAVCRLCLRWILREKRKEQE
jgi:hypothetical protein